MRGLTYEGPMRVAVSDLADPRPPGPDGAVVAVSAAGICGSDLHIYEGHGFSADTGFCVGHEAVGTVVDAGPDVRRFAVGDRVLVCASVACGSCDACRLGWVGGCTSGQAGCYGLGHRIEGSQAEAVAVPAADRNLVALPDGIGDDAGVVLTDNLPTAWFGARRARIRPGDTVAVLGLGPVGSSRSSPPRSWGRRASWPSTPSPNAAPPPPVSGPSPSTPRGSPTGCGP